MVKATLRDGRSAILFGVLSLLPQLCFSSIISVDETNVCPKLVSNGLVSNEVYWFPLIFLGNLRSIGF